MAIDKNSNFFTFGFAVITVIVVATVLSFVYLQLKPLQDANESKEKMQNILMAVQIECTRDEAEDLFAQYVTDQYVIDVEGEKKNAEASAFDIDVRKEYKSLSLEERNYPIFVVEKKDSTFYVIPMVGNGLWGPIWGYVSLSSDYNTIYGATFDHKGETPGLGAEISNTSFEIQFRGDKILGEDGNFTSVRVVKGGASSDDVHGVDGITGGTITSNGVDEMISRTLEIYNRHFKKIES